MASSLDAITLLDGIRTALGSAIGTLNYSGGQSEEALWVESSGRSRPEIPRATGLEVVVRSFLNETTIPFMGNRAILHSDYQIVCKQWSPDAGGSTIAAVDAIASEFWNRKYDVRRGGYTPRDDRLRVVEQASLFITHRRL